MQETTLNIAGMTCQGCVNSVTNALRRIAGVTEAKVSLEQRTAIVRHDAAKADANALRAAIEAAGFEVS